MNISRTETILLRNSLLSYEVLELELNKIYFIGDINKYYTCRFIINNEHQYLHIPTLNNTITSKYFKFELINNKIELINVKEVK
ncbi:MAG: hypothetical protein ACRCXT_08260 [Paraclostridium sp.]